MQRRRAKKRGDQYRDRARWEREGRVALFRFCWQERGTSLPAPRNQIAHHHPLPTPVAAFPDAPDLRLLTARSSKEVLVRYKREAERPQKRRRVEMMDKH